MNRFCKPPASKGLRSNSSFVCTPAFALAVLLAIGGMFASCAPPDSREATETTAAPSGEDAAQEASEERGPEDYNVIDHDRLPVSFAVEEIAQHLVVEVAFGDGDPLPFMFDTGAPSWVTTEIAEAHGGEVLAVLKSAAGGNKIVENPLRTYPSVTVADSLEIREFLGEEPWAVENSMLYCVTPHGLLGASGLMNAVWQVDYGSEEITAAASVDQLDHINGAIAVPFTPHPGISPSPILELPVGNGTLTFLVDTGGGIGIAINTADAASVGLAPTEDSPRIQQKAEGAAGAFEAPLIFVETAIELGDREITYPIAIGDGMAPTTQGNIGHGFLKNFVVTWDWSSSTMYLDPLAEDGGVPFPEAPLDAAVGWDGEKVVVNGLVPGGPAAVAGLALGDVVTSIDGQSVEGATIDNFCALYTAGPHERVTIEGGKTFDLQRVERFYDGR